MRNIDTWKPSVYIKKGKRFKPNYRYIYAGSTLNVNIVAVKFNDYIKKYAKGSLIDLGCGHVPMYEMYKNAITSHTCADWNDTFHKNELLDVICDLNKAPLPFDNNVYDTIILSEVLEHIRKPEQLIHEIYRIQKPQGFLLLSVPFYYPIHEQPFDYYRYTQYALSSMLEDAGYEIVEMEASGGAFESTVNLVAKIMMKLPKWGKYFAIPLQEIAWWIISGKVKRGRKIGFTRFPLGYMVAAQKK